VKAIGHVLLRGVLIGTSIQPPYAENWQLRARSFEAKPCQELFRLLRAYTN